MIPILFTIPNLITAGSGREMLNIIDRLDRSVYEPSICVIQKGGKLEEEINEKGINLIEAPYRVASCSRFNLPIKIYKASKYFRKYKFKIWHSFDWSSDYTEPLVAKMAGVKNWIYTKKNMNWDRKAWNVKTFLASKVIARNQTMMEQYFSSIHKNKAVWVRGGVDVHRFQPQEATPLNLRKKLKLSPQDKLIVSVAQIVRVKGQDTIINGLKDLPGMHLLLAGKVLDVAYKEKLDQLILKNKMTDRVHFASHVSDIPALLAESDLFILATSKVTGHEEGCPVALMEAMACGKPCIATDVAGSRDVMIHEKSGLLVAPDNSELMKQAIVKMFLDEELRNHMGSLARERMQKCFTLDQEAEAVQKVYRALKL